MRIDVGANGGWIINTNVPVKCYPANTAVPPPMDHPIRSTLLTGNGLINRGS
jgi:hypothetical protein